MTGKKKTKIRRKQARRVAHPSDSVKGSDARLRRKRWLWVCALIAGAGIAIVSPRFFTTQERSRIEPKVTRSPDAFEAFNAVMYPAARRHDAIENTFWLTGEESVEEFFEKVTEKTTDIRKRMEETAHVSQLAQQINGMYSNFLLTRYQNGASTTIEKVTEGQPIEDIFHRLEFCVIDQQQYKRHRDRIRSTLYYRTDWKALMVVGVQIPESFEVALVYHEMGHALRHKQGAPSATAHPSSDAFIAEEMEMHELEHEVVNVMTDGELNRLYDRIRSRAQDESIDAVLRAVTPPDVDAFEMLTQTRDVGSLVADITIAQFTFGLAIRTFELTLSSEEAESEGIRFYRRMRQRMGAK